MAYFSFLVKKFSGLAVFSICRWLTCV